MTDYENLTNSCKVERMQVILEALEEDRAVDANKLYFEEIKWLKSEYGDALKKEGAAIYLEV